MSTSESYQLGKENSEILLQGSEDNYQHALAMLQQAQRSVLIFSRQLDGRLYDKAEFSLALNHLARQHPRTRLRILLQQTDPLIKHGHRIIELSRRMSSAIQIRVVHESFRHHNQAFMVFDDRGLISRQYADRYEGIANYNDASEARQLSAFFNEVWELSQADPNLRRLHL